MSINIEIVSARSSTWVGIQYFFLSLFLIFISLSILTIIGLVVSSNIFGFYFAEFWQDVRLATAAVFLGVLFASLLSRRKISQAYNPRKAVLVNIGLFSMLLLYILGSDYFGDQTPHYGVSPAENIIEKLLFSIGLFIEYSFLNWLFFRKYFVKPSIPVVTHNAQPIEKDILWEIPADERRSQIQNFILRTGYIFIGLAFILPFLSFNTFIDIQLWGLDQFVSRLIYSAAGIAVVLVTFYVISKMYPYKNRAYAIDEIGITVSIGTKTKKYVWSDFEYFYQYSKRQNGFAYSTPIAEVHNQIEGSILYLQKKSGILFGFGKVFVIIRTTPENQNEVIETISMKLEENQMTQTTDLGLVLYECK